MNLPTNPEEEEFTELKTKIKEAIIASDTQNIQERMQSLGEEYMMLAERMTKDWKSVQQIQMQMAFCVKTLQARGIEVQVPGEQDSDQ